MFAWTILLRILQYKVIFIMFRTIVILVQITVSMYEMQGVSKYEMPRGCLCVQR
jgi:hypothetical protein